ncbi:DUF2061 domain-containing protein [Sinomicrobium sp. M5D2P17]
MILDLLKTQKLKPASDSRKVSVLKAVSWRLVGTIDTMIISYILTGDIKIALGIGSIEVVSKMILYYLHERAWLRITKNK